MSKVRVINQKGKATFINKRILTPNYLKRMGLTIQELESPKKEVIVQSPIEEPKKEDFITENFDEAKAKYKEVFGKKPHHSWDLSKLIEKINSK